ncbi:hypothetical protein KFK09_006480 [Dendrobium nobile]|uniref:Uncharacterized protein n=1 Tax=Dendrobium nobile TaxID=94219 RepID=A0A8T3BRG2_DENNO|nr:hypothetical protein KFK09_006480 [Dendrobium nobile]
MQNSPRSRDRLMMRKTLPAQSALDVEDSPRSRARPSMRKKVDVSLRSLSLSYLEPVAIYSHDSNLYYASCGIGRVRKP